nr:MAG TPA: hypothetical protein [Caudoviricetes sp.]
MWYSICVESQIKNRAKSGHLLYSTKCGIVYV